MQLNDKSGVWFQFWNITVGLGEDLQRPNTQSHRCGIVANMIFIEDWGSLNKVTSSREEFVGKIKSFYIVPKLIFNTYNSSLLNDLRIDLECDLMEIIKTKSVRGRERFLTEFKSKESLMTHFIGAEGWERQDLLHWSPSPGPRHISPNGQKSSNGTGINLMAKNAINCWYQPLGQKRHPIWDLSCQAKENEKEGETGFSTKMKFHVYKLTTPQLSYHSVLARPVGKTGFIHTLSSKSIQCRFLPPPNSPWMPWSHPIYSRPSPAPLSLTNGKSQNIWDQIRPETIYGTRSLILFS